MGDWVFTFGARQRYDGYYIIIKNMSFNEARKKMVAKYGIAWSGQYTLTSFKEAGLDLHMKEMAY
jgi:hypothetical protein